MSRVTSPLPTQSHDLREAGARSVPFARDLARFGDRVALVADGASVSYADLAMRVAQAAGRLGPERRLVMIEMAPDVDVLATYLGALAGGHPAVLVPANGTVDALREAYDPDVVVTAPGGRAGDWWEARRPGTRHDLHPDLALLLSTSGATGSPKLVRLSHTNVAANAESIAAYLGIRPPDRAVTSLPLSYCYGLSLLHSHLAVGASVLLTDRSVLDADFWEAFRAHGCATLSGVPHTFDLLDRCGFAEMDLPQLRYVTQAGGRMPPETVRRYAELGRRRGWDLVVMYGQTEATARMAYLPPDLAAARPEAVGVPIPGGRITVESADGAELPDGETGEIVYAGPNVMLGYAESPADLAAGRVVERLRTGDLGRRAPDGLVEVVGRAGRFAKVLGLRIDLTRVEAALADAGISAACLEGGAQLVVVVEVGDGLDRKAVARTTARASGLPVSSLRVVVTAALPRTVSGKVDHAAVRARWGAVRSEPGGASDGGADDAGGGGAHGLADGRAGGGERDRLDQLVELYSDVLGLDPGRVGPTSSFAGLGGDSMTCVALSVRLERALGWLPDGWHLMSVADLAALEPARRAGPRWAALRHLDTSVLVRAVAILLVVGSHIGLFDVRGGAHLLVGVAGYNLARFHLTSADRATRLRNVTGSVVRVLGPTLVWLTALVLLLPQEYGPSVLLVNSLVGENALTPELRYWFVEALVYFFLGVLVLVAVPGADAWERRRPLTVPLVIMVVGLLAWAVGEAALDHPRSLLSPWAVLWLFALGWAMAVAARSRRRGVLLALTVGLAVAAPFMYANDTRAAVIAVGMGLVAWIPTVPVPRLLALPATTIAAASLFIYLTHYEVYPPLRDRPLVALAASLAVGLGAWAAWGRLSRLRRPHGIITVWRRPA